MDMAPQKDIIPFFTTDSSLGKSILNSDDFEEIDKKTGKKGVKPIKETEPLSIWTISYHHKLDTMYVIEDSFIGFINHYKYAKKLGKKLVFGVKFKIVNDSKNATAESFLTECNVIVFMKNSAGYNDLIKLYSAIHGNKDRYIWDKFNMMGYNRGDWKLLQEYWTNNLLLVIPFYDSFIHRNLLEYNHHAIPEFGKMEPVFVLSKHELPFDELLQEAVKNYCIENKHEIINGHNVYYYKDSDAQAFQIFKCITLRTSYEMPELSFFSQPTFSFESWEKKIQ